MNDAIRRRDGLIDPSADYVLFEDTDINPRSKRQRFTVGIETVEDLEEARFTIKPWVWCVLIGSGVGAWALIIYGIRGVLRVLLG